jgi:hypothetical protein
VRVQECSFRCDRIGCSHGAEGYASQSPSKANWTEAKVAAVAAGWFIRPAESKPEHVCPDCVEEQLLGLKEPADQGGRSRA